jgi:hypothetical protein
MRRFAVIGLSALAATSSALAAVSVGGDPLLKPTKPYIRLVDTDPVTIRGFNYRADQRVTIVASVHEPESGRSQRQTRTVRAGGRGGFTVVLPGISIDRCGYFAVTATTADGQKAAIKIVPQCGALP